MAERAYINIIENGKSNIFYGHQAANNLTTIYSYSEALKIQSEEQSEKSITDIMANLDYDRVYNPTAAHNDRVFEITDKSELYFKRSFNDLPAMIAMKITLDLDCQTITHERRDSFIITQPIPQALEIMRDALNEADQRGLDIDDDFWEIEKIYTSKIPQIKELYDLYKSTDDLHDLYLASLTNEELYPSPMNKSFVHVVTKTADSLGWSVTHNNGEFEFSKYSPAGQDFNMSIAAESLSELNHELYNRYNDFDCSEEASVWLDESGHGKDGAPYDMKDLYEDMEACEEMIRELAAKIQELDYTDNIENNQFEYDGDYEDEDDLEP